MFKRGGTIPSIWCLIQMKRLPAGIMRLIWSLVGRSASGFQACCVRHKAFDAFTPRKRLTHTGQRGGKRV